MSRARRLLCVALLAVAGLAGCADDHDPAGSSGAHGDASVERDGSSSGGSDASATDDAASSSDAGGASADGGGATDAGGGASSDAGGPSGTDGGGSSSDAGSALDAGKDSGASQDAGSSSDTGTPSGKVSCDPQKVACDVVEPTCPQNQVPSVKNGCYGPCVVIDECSCSDAPECPQPETYTCHRSARHCGPYVN